MIIDTIKHYKFQKPIFTVHWFSPAHNNSLIILGLNESSSNMLYHYDTNGQLLMSHQFPQFVDAIVMPNQNEVIVAEVEHNELSIFDLTNHNIKHYRHNFSTKVSVQVNLEYFIDSHLLCIREHEDCNRLKLSYFAYPFKDYEQFNKNLQCQYRSSASDWSPISNIKQVDNHSQYVMYQSRHINSIKFHSFKINKSNSKGQKQILQISLQSLMQQRSISSMEIAIINIWTFGKEKFLLQTQSSNDRAINNNLIWDWRLQTIKQLPFKMGSIYQNLQIDCFGISSFSIFHTFNAIYKKVLPTPVYFICNQNCQLIKEEESMVSYLQKYQISTINKNQIYEGSYENSDVNCLRLRIFRFIGKEILSLHLLQHLKTQNGFFEWDYDFVCDIIGTLEYSQI